jgi:hypothetical protein
VTFTVPGPAHRSAGRCLEAALDRADIALLPMKAGEPFIEARVAPWRRPSRAVRVRGFRERQ